MPGMKQSLWDPLIYVWPIVVTSCVIHSAGPVPPASEVGIVLKATLGCAGWQPHGLPRVFALEASLSYAHNLVCGTAFAKHSAPFPSCEQALSNHLCASDNPVPLTLLYF